jgi:hypothetical protein
MRGLREGWTKHPWEWLLLLATLAMLITLAVAPRANGDHHFMKIRQVHPGNDPMFSTGDWVELQMFADGQNVVAGSHIRTYDPGGVLMTDFQFPSNVANSQNQRTILVGNGSTVGGVTPDFNAPIVGTPPNNDLDLTGQDGAVCFDSTVFGRIDCVSYGAFTGVGFPTGTSATPTQFGETLERTIAPNCATLLEDADDTNNSSTDFAASTRAPRNNTAVPTETACSPIPTPIPTPTPTPLTQPTVLTPAPTFDLAAAIKRCKKKFPKGPKRKKCIRKAKQRAAAT